MSGKRKTNDNLDQISTTTVKIGKSKINSSATASRSLLLPDESGTLITDTGVDAKVAAGVAAGLANTVTTNTIQTITAAKTFSSTVTTNGAVTTNATLTSNGAVTTNATLTSNGALSTTGGVSVTAGSAGKGLQVGTGAPYGAGTRLGQIFAGTVSVNGPINVGGVATTTATTTVPDTGTRVVVANIFSNDPPNNWDRCLVSVKSLPSGGNGQITFSVTNTSGVTTSASAVVNFVCFVTDS